MGVECYEDINDEMSREEVATIGEIIETVSKEVVPGVDVNIMGSFRRGKASCGDVDVHITHKAHEKSIPEDFLSAIVDQLWTRGHIAFHLTFLPGMKTGTCIHHYQEAAKFIPREVWEWSKVDGSSMRHASSSSSYMGVFLSGEKRRRVDIKFYPYRERIFASLYFTGNGFFNRSMRLRARKFNYTLNDHGLFSRGTVDRVLEASKEIEVFEKLKLKWKQPHERDSFDAVEPVSPSESLEDVKLTEAEMLNDDSRYVWVD